MRHHEHAFDRIIACVFDEETARLYEELLESIPEVPPPVKVRLRIVPWEDPSPFEIAMMARLRTMLPEHVVDHLEQTRNQGVFPQFSNPEIQKIWEEIQEDRMRVLIKAQGLEDPE